MNIKEARTFYQKQYEMFKDGMDLSILDLKAAEQIMEQVGRSFHSVLELGAGNGQLARSLATYEKDITTIELVPELVEFTREFQTENVTSLCGNFYDIELSKVFDLILYIDGFGVGTDEEQLRLLKRIHNWLADDGVALIDIYQPLYWKKTIGQKMAPFPNSNITRVYGFDEENQRMTDTWWKDEHPEDTYTQSLACYSPEEIEALCKQANLQITAYFPGGAMDFQRWEYHEVVGLGECLSYRIKVEKERAK